MKKTCYDFKMKYTECVCDRHPLIKLTVKCLQKF